MQRFRVRVALKLSYVIEDWDCPMDSGGNGEFHRMFVPRLELEAGARPVFLAYDKLRLKLLIRTSGRIDLIDRCRSPQRVEPTPKPQNARTTPRIPLPGSEENFPVPTTRRWEVALNATEELDVSLPARPKGSPLTHSFLRPNGRHGFLLTTSAHPRPTNSDETDELGTAVRCCRYIQQSRLPRCWEGIFLRATL